MTKFYIFTTWSCLMDLCSHFHSYFTLVEIINLPRLLQRVSRDRSCRHTNNKLLFPKHMLLSSSNNLWLLAFNLTDENSYLNSLGILWSKSNLNILVCFITLIKWNFSWFPNIIHVLTTLFFASQCSLCFPCMCSLFIPTCRGQISLL